MVTVKEGVKVVSRAEAKEGQGSTAAVVLGLILGMMTGIVFNNNSRHDSSSSSSSIVGFDSRDAFPNVGVLTVVDPDMVQIVPTYPSSASPLPSQSNVITTKATISSAKSGRRGMEVQQSVDLFQGTPPSNAVSSFSHLKKRKKKRKKCHTGPLPPRTRWSCRHQPHRCVVLYHSFVLRPDLFKILMEFGHADEVFWMTVHGALAFRKHYPELPIVLATNYPKGYLEKILNNLFHDKTRGVHRKFLEDHLSAVEIANGTWRSVFGKILYPPAKSHDDDNLPFYFLLKPDAMDFEGLEQYDRVLFLDGDAVVQRREFPLVSPSRFGGGELEPKLNHGRCFRNFRGVRLNPRREQEVAARLARKSLAKGELPGYTPNILYGLNPIHIKLATNDSVTTTTISTDYRTLKSRATEWAGYGKNSRRSIDGSHQYADFYDIFDQLNFYDLSLVPEYASFHDMSNAMYFGFFGFQNDCESPFESVRQGKKGIYGCRYAWRNRYETQFNTGLIAFRNTRCVKNQYMKRWRLTHRNSRCLKDNTAWDQCSFPWAIRKTNLRVGVLPEPFNFRTALGKGCSPFLHPNPRGHNFPHFPLWPKPAIVMDHDHPRPRVISKLIYRYGLAVDHFTCPPYKPHSPIANATFLTQSNCTNPQDPAHRITMGRQELALPQYGGVIKCKGTKGSHWASNYMPCMWKYHNNSYCGQPYHEGVTVRSNPWECGTP